MTEPDTTPDNRLGGTMAYCDGSSEQFCWCDDELVRITTGRHFGIPFAHVLDGSVVLATFVGLTRQHAARRARDYLT